ncbi:MAG: hypothetical protein OXC01_15545, partial [Immundisolibacterales bacterium]|nr:hypothetical protein [Immundisolibacterales bacterium]
MLSSTKRSLVAVATAAAFLGVSAVGAQAADQLKFSYLMHDKPEGVFWNIVSEANYLQQTDWTVFFWICPARITENVSGSRMGTEAPTCDVFAGR